MGRVAETSTSSHFNSQSQALQLKLYQAFIFSIPILFSIILFLLFYLFYLKRRTSSLSYSQTPQLLPTNSNQASTTLYVSSLSLSDLKVEFMDKLPKILLDEELRARDPQCCVCLGEFEVEEELLQIPYCKHVFHVECIHYWLQSNWTCPLCRCSVIPTKFLNGNMDNAAAAPAPAPAPAATPTQAPLPPTSSLMELELIRQAPGVTQHNPPLAIHNSICS